MSLPINYYVSGEIQRSYYILGKLSVGFLNFMFSELILFRFEFHTLSL